MNKIYQIDCVDGAKKYLDDNSVDLIIADPPYNLNYGGTNSKRTKKPRFGQFANDHLSIRDYYRFTRSWLQEAHRVLKPERHIYVFIDWRMYSYLFIWLQRVGFKIKNLIVWDKKHFGMGNYYRYQHELIIFAWKGKRAVPLRLKNRNVPDVWQVPKLAASRMIHPTEKPVDLMKRIIEYSSAPDELVVDFFAGSGVSGEAAVNLNRKYIGFELDEDYTFKGNERIEKCDSNSFCF